MVFGGLVLAAGAWMDFLLFAQVLFGVTLDGQPGTKLDPTVAFPVWGGITALGIALWIIGKRLRTKALASDRDNFEHSIDNFH